MFEAFILTVDEFSTSSTRALIMCHNIKCNSNDTTVEVLSLYGTNP